MKKPWKIRLALLAVGAVLAVALGVYFSRNTISPSATLHPGEPEVENAQTSSRSPASESADSKVASQAAGVPKSKTDLEVASEALAPLMAAPVSLPDGGTRREFQLSTTEVSVRGQDGSKQIVSLPPSDSPEAFATALEKIRAEHGAEPELVLYPRGFPQDESTRRIATREVMITAPSRAEADALAAARGLVFKKAPAFAPNAFVYEAVNSQSALAVQISQENLKVTPLLAMQPRKFQVPNDPYFQLQWHLKHQGQQGAVPGTDINVLELWKYPETTAGKYIRGQGVAIGIADDGLQWSHPDLAVNVLPALQWDWNQGDNDPSPYYNSDAHGTACAGVAAARGNNRIGVSGVAPEANLVGMRLISDPITDLDEAEAMTWLADQVHIKSNSWGWPQLDDFGTWYPMRKNGDLANAALRYAIDFGRGGKGTIITFAAGNSYEYYDLNTQVYKTSGARVEFSDFQGSPYTITVAAVNSRGIKSDYSQVGSALLISAPSNTADGSGLGIMTTDNKGFYGYNPGFAPGDFPSSGDVTRTFGGTSSACPTVSGVIALMLQKNPDLGWRDVQEILIRSAAQVDANDPGWITANRSDHVTGNNTVRFKFNDKYGAGLVDAAAAVALSGNWSNLPAQASSTVTSNLTQPLAPGASVNRTFSISDSLRVEHVTLAVSIPGIKKGDLEISLTSPAGTNSIFCEPHSDQSNDFNNWTFMTVRNWGEHSTGGNGNWTLTVRNTSPTATGNLGSTQLTVFGTPTTLPKNPLPVINLQVSRFTTFNGTSITLQATATDKNFNNTQGAIAKVEFFSNNGSGPVSIGNATNAPGNNTFSYIWRPPSVGNYTFTAVATDSGDLTSNSTAVSAASAPVSLRVDRYPVAAWDFDTPAQSVVPLATAIQSVRRYDANFGSNNATYAKIVFDGTVGSSLWNSNSGEIWTGTGSTLNFLADSNPNSPNAGLVLRGGTNLAANGKSLVFLLDMTNARRLDISYVAQNANGGFTTHTWEYWDEKKGGAGGWQPILDENGNPTIPVPAVPTLIVLDQVVGTGFNGRAGARVRLTVTGATRVSGTNLLDNIRFNATVQP